MTIVMIPPVIPVSSLLSLQIVISNATSNFRIHDRTIGSFLLVAFQTRYRDVLVKAHRLTLTMTTKYLTLLTNEETKLALFLVADGWTEISSSSCTWEEKEADLDGIHALS
ncbi:uncharacterized protein LOC121769690 [Salvia splendens]|uniref:uncharacterized protein LOC121769690 n=1 Tax=Salvia splendens TaxID=180675 RepID=UPI001C26C93A|nr:uncharacterized protein LOC121769690 [Salvia splendens]